MGYTGGTTADPTYRQIGDHAEALQVDFDPAEISFAELLELFWKSHDPTRPHFSTQYLSAVYYADDAQRTHAETSGEAAVRGREGVLATQIVPLERFYRAEDYHQKYRLRRHPELVAELVGRFKTDRGMVDSTAAARLNGLFGGHGGRDAITRLESLDLSRRTLDLARERVA